MKVEGTDVRQLTSGTDHNFDPVWLPDGGIAFLSTRVNQFPPRINAPCSWHDRPLRCRSAFRNYLPAWMGAYDVGFRVVATTKSKP